MLPYSEACERNKDAILNVLRRLFQDIDEVLEIGSGTGQHAVYFAKHLPHLTWRSGDVPDHHPGIQGWITEVGSPNVQSPLALDLHDDSWPIDAVPAIFSANVLHIVSEALVARFFDHAGRILSANGLLVVYGPFKTNGAFSSESNAAFDQSLRMRDPLSGIRDKETLNAFAKAQHMHLEENLYLPANNEVLVWRKA